MSLGLRLLLMTRFGRPLPTTPDICIGVPSPAPAHAGHPHQPLRAGTGCCRYLWIWAVQNETGLQIYFLLSYRYPGSAAWRSPWRWCCLRVGAVTAATSRTSGADPAVLTRLTWERISLPYQSVPRNLTRPWGTDHRACTLYTLLRGNGTLGLIKLISEGIQISNSFSSVYYSFMLPWMRCCQATEIDTLREVIQILPQHWEPLTPGRALYRGHQGQKVTAQEEMQF